MSDAYVAVLGCTECEFNAMTVDERIARLAKALVADHSTTRHRENLAAIARWARESLRASTAGSGAG